MHKSGTVHAWMHAGLWRTAFHLRTRFLLITEVKKSTKLSFCNACSVFEFKENCKHKNTFACSGRKVKSFYASGALSKLTADCHRLKMNYIRDFKSVALMHLAQHVHIHPWDLSEKPLWTFTFDDLPVSTDQQLVVRECRSSFSSAARKLAHMPTE